jgi:AcrR family transcriptional regulator
MSVVVQLLIIFSYNRLSGADAPFDTTIRNARPVYLFPEVIQVTEPDRPLRADAARNRARVLEVAYETFAAEGLSVPIDEIARRAGVGAGTVYRHFPTKDDLYRAVVEDRITTIIEGGRALIDAGDPGNALFSFQRSMVLQWGATDQGLTEALAGVGIDISAAMPDVEQGFLAMLDDLLQASQKAGTVRDDLSVRDVKALLTGASAVQAAYPDTAERVTEVFLDGLRAR